MEQAIEKLKAARDNATHIHELISTMEGFAKEVSSATGYEEGVKKMALAGLKEITDTMWDFCIYPLDEAIEKLEGGAT